MTETSASQQNYCKAINAHMVPIIPLTTDSVRLERPVILAKPDRCVQRVVVGGPDIQAENHNRGQQQSLRYHDVRDIRLADGGSACRAKDKHQRVAEEKSDHRNQYGAFGMTPKRTKSAVSVPALINDPTTSASALEKSSGVCGTIVFKCSSRPRR
ncbi:Uncharacterised protein [Salmonella enterica subsp. arizonae]|uniref:Uncharacterized protein n=1 Tax=Salmonella enterica subsp. arizonae TaxID=59203 RepID=A0A2X4W8Y5_SALER|nr:Uncharacterised protein [Salmonella enterica subsp. arizonae]